MLIVVEAIWRIHGISDILSHPLYLKSPVIKGKQKRQNHSSSMLLRNMGETAKLKELILVMFTKLSLYLQVGMETSDFCLL